MEDYHNINAQNISLSKSFLPQLPSFNMAEALVSKVLEQLASIIHQQREERIRLIVGVDEEVGKLTSNFQAIQAVLVDAEKRQVKVSAVRDWLDKVKGISYDVDDVLDDWNTTIQKLQSEKAENASKPLRKVCSLIPYYLCFCTKLVLRYDIAVKVRNLDRELDIIAREKDSFKFSSITMGSEKPEPQMTTSVIDVTETCGRDEEKNRLLDLLLSQSSQEDVIPIISIVGMEGIGKTALARSVFNDDLVKKHFDKTIWVCVSKSFDEIRIAKAIYESLRGSPSDLEKWEILLELIRQRVEKRKFLLVLDDVWTANPRKWEELRSTLNYGSHESRILVTTPTINVADVIGVTYMMTLEMLLEEECWSMFSKIAFFGRTYEERKNLEEIGKRIVQKCKGLPLAIKILASLLLFKTKIEEWQDILYSEIWELKEAKEGLFPPLLLSYYDLSSMLKKCFSYCAIFPKDYKIQKDELIKLWMAQNYLKTKNDNNIELVGEEYFKILAMRCFFQDFEKDQLEDITSFQMHSIIYDFAQFLTENEFFMIEFDEDGKVNYEPSYKRFRHLTIKVHVSGSIPSSLYNQKFLHSLVVVREFGLKTRISLSKLFDQLTCLRTLNLSNQKFRKIPIKINRLIHLRYFNLSQNDYLKILPNTLCELCNLQILDISGCSSLQRLPQGIGKLINLRHLENWGTSYPRYMPKSFERLTRLRTVGEFMISDGGRCGKSCSLECLKNFTHLQNIEIEDLGKLTSVGKALEVELHNKKNLRVLSLEFYGDNNNHFEVLEALRPPPNLEKLKIIRYRPCLSPDWLMSLTKLRELVIDSCYSGDFYVLGKLSSLESLKISWMDFLKKLGNEFLGIERDGTSSSSSVIILPKLKFLHFSYMGGWEEWNYEIKERGEGEITVMPCLQTLKIESCPKLKSLPNHLRQMTTLKMVVDDCPLLEEILKNDRPSSSPALTN